MNPQKTYQVQVSYVLHGYIEIEAETPIQAQNRVLDELEQLGEEAIEHYGEIQGREYDTHEILEIKL